jgi:hypothetical protein
VGYGTGGSATVTVTGTDFYATNLTIKNTADYESPNFLNNGQAVALNSRGDRAVYRAVEILGGQDTLYVNKRAYFNNYYVEGTVDFIFGNGKAVFYGGKIKAKANGSLNGEVTITAQNRASASEDSGYVFNNTTILFDDDYMTNVWLGRPWGPFSTVYFLNTKMGPQVAKQGWIEFSPQEYAPPGMGTHNLQTSTYREYNTTYGSTSFDISKRESISPKSNVPLSAAETTALQAEKYLAGSDGWNPNLVTYGTLTAQALPIPTVPVGVPAAPMINLVTAGNQNLQANWSGMPANPQISGYRVWAIQNGKTHGPVDLPRTASSGFVDGLSNGVPAQIYVVGINAQGVGHTAASSSVTPASDAPSVPGNVHFQFNGSSVTMSFTIADQGSQLVFGGKVPSAGVYTALYASKDAAFAGSAIAGTSAGFGSTSWTFNNLKPNTTYWVSLWAYNGKSSPTLFTSFTTGTF